MDDFARIEARGLSSAAAEIVVAEAYAAGAAGLEEREEEGDGVALIVYAPADRAAAVRAAVVAAAGAAVRVSGAEAVAPENWAEAWKAHATAIVVSPALVVRPSFVPRSLTPGQAELVIDPGQAFGTGGHASTRLALEWIGALAPELDPRVRVLDVGTGSGVLLLAAARLAGASGVGFDLDPLAAPAARDAARSNGLSDRACFFTGPLESVAGPGFGLIVANLLRRELLPLLPGIARRLRPGGRAILSGLLAGELDSVRDAARDVGLEGAGTRTRREGGELWGSVLMSPRAASASPR